VNLQALIDFADNREQDGGFHLVPGFQDILLTWVSDSQRRNVNKSYGRRQTFIVLPESECIQRLAVRITLRAGSLLIWDQRVCHGSAPNSSSNIRFAQFLKLFPANPIHPKRAELRAKKLSEKIQEANFTQLTELGERLFGLKPSHS